MLILRILNGKRAANKGNEDLCTNPGHSLSVASVSVSARSRRSLHDLTGTYPGVPPRLTTPRDPSSGVPAGSKISLGQYSQTIRGLVNILVSVCPVHGAETLLIYRHAHETTHANP